MAHQGQLVSLSTLTGKHHVSSDMQSSGAEMNTSIGSLSARRSGTSAAFRMPRSRPRCGLHSTGPPRRCGRRREAPVALQASCDVLLRGADARGLRLPQLPRPRRRGAPRAFLPGVLWMAPPCTMRWSGSGRFLR
ncbi:hypothetical protein SEVIR_9G432275v4 [Setaria viridis]